MSGRDAGEVYRRLALAVLGYLRGQGVPDPDDVLSEVFLQVARALPRFRGEDAELRPWVFTIARHRAIDDRRRRARRVRTSALGDDAVELAEPGPADPVDPQLLGALRELTADQREVVVLRFVADLSLEQVAAVTQRPVGAVKSMQHRALGQLARILGEGPGAVGGDG